MIDQRIETFSVNLRVQKTKGSTVYPLETPFSPTKTVSWVPLRGPEEPKVV